MLPLSSSSIFVNQNSFNKGHQHCPITIAIDCNGHSLHIFEKKWPNYASAPKSALYTDLFWVRRLFNVCVRFSCTSNVTILVVYIPVKIKMSFIPKDDLFFAKIGVFCKSIAGPLSEAKMHWIVNCMASYPRSLCKIRLKDVSEVFNCWEHRSIDVVGASRTYCHSSNIHGCTQCFLRFGLSMGMPVSFTFFLR